MALAKKVCISLLVLLSIFIECSISRCMGTPQSLAQLNANRNKFNNINNGCYSFQYSRLCFCFQCFVQNMNVKVVNNVVESVEFAEGDDFAVDNFCFGNIEPRDAALSDSSRTIDDLFDEIEGQINNGMAVNVIYHPTIGIPLDISIDSIPPPGGPDIADDEYFYKINCIEFDSSCSAYSQRSSRKKRKIHKFHKNDEYSCNNIEIPDSCPSDRAGQNLGGIAFDCNRYSDGCNTCSCDGTDVVGCTKRVCSDETTGTPRCLDCESNTQWTECGDVCNRECGDDLTCGLRFFTAPGCSESRCQCPSSHPFWDGEECIDEKECGLNTVSPAPTEIIIDNFCPEFCNKYNDGCEQCSCDENGNSFNCAIAGGSSCEPGFRTNAVCVECKDPETMQYTNCGSCTTTCNQLLSDLLLLCPAVCQNKCECKPDTPYYDEEQGKCVTEQECRDGAEPQPSECAVVDHCVEYTDGCFECVCPGGDTGPSFCFSINPDCVPNSAPACLECEDPDTMQYTECGSCDKTCDEPNPFCITLCETKCECKPETPIYSEVDGKCITLDECPAQQPCCPPAEQPGFGGTPICTDGVRCCPDGTWTCGNGDGSFSCNGQVTNTFGEVCEDQIIILPPPPPPPLPQLP